MLLIFSSLSLVKCRSIKRARKCKEIAHVISTKPPFKKKTLVRLSRILPPFVCNGNTKVLSPLKKRSLSLAQNSLARSLALSAGTSSHARSRSPFVVVVVLESVVLLLLLSSIKESICWDIRQQKSPTPARRRISNSCALIKKRKKR